MSSSYVDNWNNPVVFGENFIEYRNRILDYGAINTFCVKNKRLLINFYKQNTNLPTMCIIFTDKEKAETALAELKYAMFYTSNQEPLLTRLRALLGI